MWLAPRSRKGRRLLMELYYAWILVMALLIVYRPPKR